MLRVAVKLLLAAAAVAAVWSFVPVGGRTMAARWQRARSPAALVEGLWAEVHGELARAAQPSHPARPAAPPRAQARVATAPARPTESHTEADRQALDRLVSRHADGR
jgi:hypothetical protein